MSVFHNNALIGSGGGAAAAAVDVATKSLRFNSADSADLRRQPSSSSNRRTFTISFWVKRGKLGANQRVLSTATNDFIRFESNDTFLVFETFARLRTEQVFRDCSSFYHFCVSVDTTQATASNRVKFYVNGTQVTDFSTETYPPQNEDGPINFTTQHQIGSGTVEYFDGYLADFYLIDGSQLDPTSFGAYDDNGVWQAAAYSGTFGTNGFHLQFDDVSSNAALGTDSSGNGNTFSVQNITAGPEKATGYVTGSGNPANASGSGGWDQAFDGSTSTLVYNSNGSTTTTFNLHQSLAWTSKIRIYAGQNGTSGTNIIANGTNLSSSHTWPLSGGWQEVTSSLTSPLTSLGLTSVGGQSSNIRAVEIDDTIVVQVKGRDVDVLFDVPTNGDQSDTGAGGEVSGNYCTLNPLTGGGTLSQGNLRNTTTSTNPDVGTIGLTSGKWYWEVTLTTSTNPRVGVYDIGAPEITNLGGNAYGWALINAPSRVFHNGSTTSYSGFGGSAGTVVMVAYDADAGKIWYGVNGTFLGSGDPANGSNPSQTSVTGTAIAPASSSGTGSNVHDWNFGARSFKYTAPSGFKAINTASLPTPAIADGSDYFDIKTYTGNGGNQTISGYDFGPDFVWLKNRAGGTSSTIWHVLADTVRGNNAIFANSNNVEVSGYLNGFTLDGFKVQVSPNDTANKSGDSYVAWAWEGGSSTVTNTDGNISAQVRANQTAGFSIITYTGNGSTSGTVGHGLNASPGLTIVKARNAALDIKVNHSSLSSQNMVSLDQNYQDNIASWNGVTNSVFKPARSGDTYLNGNGTNYLAYCFAPIEGFSKFSSFSGNGAVDGPFVYTGFRPALIIYKNITDTENWLMIDSTRDPYNPLDTHLHPNLPNGDSDASPPWADFLSNGFKLRNLYNETNGSGDTILYMAWAENPFQANGGLAR